MLTDEELFYEGKEAIRKKTEGLIPYSKKLDTYLKSVALTFDMKGFVHRASLFVTDTVKGKKLCISVDKISTKMLETRKFYNYSRRSKGLNHDKNLISLQESFIAELPEILKDADTVYYEDISTYCYGHPKLKADMGIDLYSRSYLQAVCLMGEALQKLNVNAVPVKPNRRVLRCMGCGIELTDEKVLNTFVKPVCPYCATHTDIMSTVVKSFVPAYSSIAVQLLLEQLPKNVEIFNMSIPYMEEDTYEECVEDEVDEYDTAEFE